MEREAKRKAASGAGTEIEHRPSKRQKLPDDAEETVESVRALGLQFLQALRNAKDKTGRPIADHFLTLPDKDAIPEYYDEVKLPIAIDTIEDKLYRGEYSTLSQVESDCKRMVLNAKTFNAKNSPVYDDAERIRKTASNFMTKHNPAYRDGHYQAQPTPIPGEENATPARPQPRPPRPAPSTAATPATAERSRRATTAQQTNTPVPKSQQQVAAGGKTSGQNYVGKNFQQAQERIIGELIQHVDESSGLQIFLPFINLPSRSLKDYYQLIKQPMSLQAVQKKVNGVIGRAPPTGNTVYTSWADFEHDMSLIWTNAREYNEDGSEIYELSLELEEMFKQRLEEAKEKVEEPPQPKLKINMSAPLKNQSIKLRLGRTSPAVSSDANTPGARSSGTPGVIVDNEALQRQQRHVQESMRSKSSERNPFHAPRNTSIPPPPAGLPNGAASPAVNGVKNDPSSVQSPALSSIRPVSAQQGYTPIASMPPPQSLSRTASGSPHPNGVAAQQAQAYPQQQAPSYYVPPASLHTDLFRSVHLKSPSEALVPKVVLKTHPALNSPRPWSASVVASKQKTQTSATFHIHHSHYLLQVIPHLPIAHTQRLYRVFVTVNNTRTLATSRPVPAGLNGNGVGYEGGKKKGEPLYEAKLVPGVNKIEVEVIAEKEAKKGEKPKNEKEDVDKEKCILYVDLMRT